MAATIFYCTNCGNETPKWAGRCSFCGEWNSIVEGETVKVTATSRISAATRSTPHRISELNTTGEMRFGTGMGELDRVLGGGAVRGSLTLFGGAPGIGKSTLLLQTCGKMPDETVLYVTGEESARQLKMRADRLGVSGENLYVLPETDMEDIIETVGEVKPDLLIIDSIQTMYNSSLTSSPGSVGQVKDCTMSLMRIAKILGTTIFIVGHVNKEGSIAGPKVLEHMVDCVVYFEGDRNTSYRIVRAAKNRFGSTNEIGVFEMSDSGLREVPNPSEVLLAGRPENTPGTCVACVVEGSRPILAEIQALVTLTSLGVARRNSNGVDYNRAMLLLAVLEKRGGIALSGCDAYINVIGGLNLDEPAADLATILAIASSAGDIPLGNDLAAIGEVGLTGEVRSVMSLPQRLAEVARLGLRRCVIPADAKEKVTPPKGLELIFVRSVNESIRATLTKKSV